jgi:coenzyme F420-reducing hydrogenase alpha subunit
MKGEGQLDIVVTRADGQPRVVITSSRPLGLTRTLVGMTCDDAVALIPLLFSVCGMSQGAAAAEAVGASRGLDVKASTRTARLLLVVAEAAREHLIAGVRDWARLANMQPEDAALLRIMQDFKRLRAAIDLSRNALRLDGAAALDPAAVEAGITALEATIETLVLEETCERFLARASASQFIAWAEAGRGPAQRFAALLSASKWTDAGATKVETLPAACAIPLLPRLLGPAARAFAAAPTWDGSPCETTAFGRQASQPLVRALSQKHGSGLLTRLTARLVELAALPQFMRCVLSGARRPSAWSYDVSSAAGDAGTAEIDTARGRLIHAARTRNGRIEDYAILAPTEWNFHPQGVAARALHVIAASSKDFEPKARAFLQVLDPCVAFDVRAS